ncbi:hypothetical protein, partial [Gemmatimonas sp.]|uniref:hypothetical protein n=1 Tax=Gemmatimonas sp. TaxID=1962908 RepID=UPI003342D64D
QRFAVEMLRDECTDEERDTWDRVVAARSSDTVTLLDRLADAMAAKRANSNAAGAVGVAA